MRMTNILLISALISMAAFCRQAYAQESQTVPDDLEQIRKEFNLPPHGLSPHVISRLRDYKRYKETPAIKRIDGALERNEITLSTAVLYKIYAAEDKKKLPPEYVTADRPEWRFVEIEFGRNHPNIAEETLREIFPYLKKRYKKPFGVHRIEMTIQKDRGAGKITDEEYLLYTAYALYEPASLPGKYKNSESYREFERRGYIYPDAAPDMHDMYYDGAEKNLRNRINQVWLNLSQNTRKKLEPILRKNNIPMPQQVEHRKTTLELIEEAYKKGEVDFDDMVLYKHYFSLKRLEKIPQKYHGAVLIGNIANQELHWAVEIFSRELREEHWDKLRPETKETLKKDTWLSRYRRTLWPENPNPVINITSPSDSEIIKSRVISVRGVIKTPEIFELGKVWIEIDGKSQEIKLAQAEYIPPEEVFKETNKEYYSVIKEQYKDKPDVVELLGPPGQKVYRFSETVNLEKYGKNMITIKANSEGGAGESHIFIDYYDKNDKNPPEITFIQPQDGENIEDYKIIQLSENDRRINIKAEISDDKGIISARLFVDDAEIWGGRLPEIRSLYQFTDAVPIKSGVNIIKITAEDIGNNISEKSIAVYVK